jgi:hypothetical protein
VIRIEGIPVVAFRLAQAQKGKAVQTPKKNRRTSKVTTSGKAATAASSLPESKVA